MFPKSATQHAVLMILVCGSQTWEHVGVIACAVKMLNVGRLESGKLEFGRLKSP
jgi:hypothetical protein